MNQLTQVLRGADPELFLVDVNGTPVSSIGLIGGSKSDPRSIGDGYALQEDNVAVEFNIPPAASKQQFIDSIQHVLTHLHGELAAQGLSLSIVPTLDFDKESLSHPQAQQLGCEPDFNVWTGGENPKPIPPDSLRSAGGHLHLSWSKPKDEERAEVIRLHDLFCGVPSIKLDSDVRRRLLYGKAGAYRPKFYGVEYRTLSNFWIKSKELTGWLFSQSEKAVEFFNSGKTLDAADYVKVQECINNNDVKLLAELDEKYSITA